MWILCRDRMPTQADTHESRLPVLDEDGFLMIAFLHGGSLLCETTPIYWMAVPPDPEG